MCCPNKFLWHCGIKRYRFLRTLVGLIASNFSRFTYFIREQGGVVSTVSSFFASKVLVVCVNKTMSKTDLDR